MNKQIALAADHGGFVLKTSLDTLVGITELRSNRPGSSYLQFR